MSPLLLAVLAVILAYLVGAIPFAYLVVYAVKGVDIRTVGSGNVGATNAGRVLGFKFFLLVFLMDLLKGLLPTVYLPSAVAALGGSAIPSLKVFVALAAILGHNFPIYLRFRGGKGVATSLGAVGALDPVASSATFAAFLVFLLVTKYVSLSSMAAATIFVLVHFSLTPRPFDRSNLAMSLVTLLLWGMLLVRHRKNFGRIWAGAEPKVSFRKGKTPPKGYIRSAAIGLLALGVIASVLFALWARPRSFDCGAFVLAPVARTSTGHQRTERLAFADGGRRLAVTCPRYQRLMVYRVAEGQSLELMRDVDVEGRAVAVWPLHDRFLALIRPGGDARHVEAAWLQAIDFDGKKLGSKFRVGFDPDDLAVTSDGLWAFVLLSGRAEGESNRPAPELISVDLSEPTQPRIVGRLTFDRPEDNPERIQLSRSDQKAAVSLFGSNQIAAIDLAEPAQPRLIARQPMPPLDLPYPSLKQGDWIMMPAGSDRDAVLVTLPGEPGPRDGLKGSYIIGTLPEGSGLEVIHAARSKSLGRLALRGAGNLGTICPAGIAYSPERRLLAVSNRSGGSVHLVTIQPKDEARPAEDRIAVRTR
jgi:acyl-phosphate glycerol 3-phosphate acyltransferase